LLTTRIIGFKSYKFVSIQIDIPIQNSILKGQNLIMFEQNNENKLIEGEDFYYTPEGYKCFTEKYHLKRGYCCKSGCRHCPYGYDKKTGTIKKPTKNPK